MRKILVVEDGPDIQELLAAYLRDAGNGVEIAGDGLAALDCFQRGAFDLVLLDLMLPKIDGFGVCEFIRRESDVPILMLTALDGEAEQLRGIELAGEQQYYTSDAYIEKIAREQLGLIKPNERIFINRSND